MNRNINPRFGNKRRYDKLDNAQKLKLLNLREFSFGHFSSPAREHVHYIYIYIYISKIHQDSMTTN